MNMNSNTNTIQTNQTAVSETATPSLNYSMISDFIAFLDVKPRTVDTYRKALKQFFLFLNQNEITQPQRIDIIKYRDTINANHKATTTQSYLNAVKRFFEYCETMGYYPDITKHVKNVKIDRTNYRKDYLRQGQLREIISLLEEDQSQEGLRNIALFRLAVTCGLRTIEIERANVEDIKLHNGEVVLFVQGKGKDDKRECVKLEPKTLEAIKEYLATRPEIKDNEPLFVSTSNRNLNGRMTTRSIRTVLKNAMVNAGYESDLLTAHSLRHTAATLNLRAGAPIEEVKQFLRHSNISNTLIYTHMLEAEKNQCSTRIGMMF